MSHQKKVISFYYKHKPGGFTTRLYKAWRGLADAGYQVTYISTEELPVNHEAVKVQLISCKSRQGTPLFWLEYFIRAIFEARRSVKEEKVECFFVFQFFYSMLAVLAGLGNNTKTLVFIRGDDFYDASFKSFATIRAGVHRFLEKFSVKHVAMVVATNKDMMNTLKARNTSQAEFDYLPNNIVNADKEYSEAKYSAEDGVFRFVSTSVLNERKNILYALKALVKLEASNWEYLIIGADVENTGYGDQLEVFIQKHNLQSKVKMLGWQDNVDMLMSRCDLFVIPTTMEGSPNALLEALGVRISCIGSNIPEVAELLDDPELVFDLKNPESLTKQLNAFCSDPAYREKLAALSKGCRERYVFNWENRVVSFVEAIQQNVAESSEHNAIKLD